MKLLSLNVALFEDNNSQVSKFLEEQEPDIACFQEVAFSQNSKVKQNYLSKNSIDQALKKLKHSYFGLTWIIKDFHLKNFHKKESFDFDFGGFLKSGNYFKSRYKILKKSNIYFGNRNVKVTDWSIWPEKQSKAVQVIDLDLPKGKKLRILNYHGIWTKEKTGNHMTLAACKKINKLAKKVDYPVIITGDFNLLPNTPSMKVFKDFTSLVDKYKIQTTRPQSNELSHLERNVIDYILVSKRIKVNNFVVPSLEISDHLPLILDFEL